MLGVPPIAGTETSSRPTTGSTGPTWSILSDALWRRRFGGDRAIVGRQITLDDDSYVGHRRHAERLRERAGARRPSCGRRCSTTCRRDARGVITCARWAGSGRASASIDAARELDGLGARRCWSSQQRPETYARERGFIVRSLQDDVTRGVKPALLAILGAVTLVLVIACVNVTNLLLARGVQRRGEFALRAALGAGRGRLIRQLLTESLLLAALGGAAGMAVAMLGVRALVALSPPGLPRVGAIGVDGAVFAFGLGITTLIGLAVRADPGAAGGAQRSAPATSSTARARTAGGHRRARSALVVAEVALALVLLVSSGLLLRSLERLFAVERGLRLVAPAHDAGADLRSPVRRRQHHASVLRGGARGGAARARRHGGGASPASCR